MEEFGRGERDVVRPNVQYAAGIILATVDPVAVQVHGGFRPSRAAGCPEPESGGVLAGRRWVQLGGSVFKKLIPMEVSFHRLSAYDHGFAVALPRQGWSKFRKKRRVNERNSGVALLQEVGVIACPQSRARGHSYGADLHRAQVGDRKLRDIREHQQHSLFLLEPPIEQSISGAIHLLSNFGVSKLPNSADNRGLAAAALPEVAVHEMVYQIVLVRNVEPMHQEAVYCIFRCSRSGLAARG